MEDAGVLVVEDDRDPVAGMDRDTRLRKCCTSGLHDYRATAC